MKRLRVTLTICAFVCAIAGATASNALYPNFGVYGRSSFTFQCVAGNTPMEFGCGNIGLYQCTVYIQGPTPITSQVTGAYSIQLNGYMCLAPILRW